MNIENKKYLVYGGVAFLVGSLGYFVYTTLKNKNSNVARTEKLQSTDEQEKYTSEKNPFRDMLDNPIIPPKIDWKFNPIDSGYNLDFKPFTTKSVLL